MKPEYQRAYHQLNPKQRQAVDTIEGPVMVLAGPGTGKTQVIATRIAHILTKTDAKPVNILALTFTDAAAKNMRDRLIELIGPTAYRVPVMTFHSFCNDVIQDFPEAFPIDRSAQVLSEVERFTLLEQLLDTVSLELLRPVNRPNYYVRDCLKAISTLKKEGMTPDAFETIIVDAWEIPEKATKATKLQLEKNKQKNLDLLALYRAYEVALRDQLRYDFDDMVSLVVEVMSENELVRLQYQETFHYVLVDEYQDTNSAQNQVVDLLMSYWSEQANLFVVGDPNQSIFRFQGASLANTASFIDRYPKAEVIVLEQGYRCGNDLYQLAHTLITTEQATPRSSNTPLATILAQINQAPLSSDQKQAGTAQIIQAPSQLSEYLWITERIKQLIASGMEPRAISVLFRTNQEIQAFEQVFARSAVPYQSEAGTDILQLPAIQQLLQLLRTVEAVRCNEPHPDLFTLLTREWFGLPTIIMLKLARLAHAHKISLIDVLVSGSQPTSTVAQYQLSPLEWEAVQQAFQRMLAWITRLDAVSLPEWFVEVIAESGFRDWLLKQPDKFELLSAVNTLFSEIKAQARLNPRATLADFLHALEAIESYQLRVISQPLTLQTNVVALATVHKAKGREWGAVFVPGLIDGRWGNSRQRQVLPLPATIIPYGDVDQDSQTTDDLRLFYVAITRAKSQLFLSYSDTIVDQSRQRATVLSEYVASLEAAAPALVQRVAAESELPPADEQLQQLLVPVSAVRALQSDERAYFQYLADHLSLSVSTLNKYLRDPNEFVHDVLLRLPKAKEPAMAFGTAVHTALEQFYTDYLKQQKFPSEATLLEYFVQALDREVLTDTERAARRKKGKEILHSYHQSIKSQSPAVVSLETFFGHGQHPTYLDDIHLTGRIDRIDWENKQKNTVAVIDYKTGKPKSLNAIIGVSQTERYSERELALPESIRGVYKRQLLFYVLLTQLSARFQPTVTHGTFEFIEPNASGKLVQHQLELPQSEVDELKQLIREVVSEIRSLKFLDQVTL